MLLNQTAPTRRYVITVYGATGTGKSTMSTTLPKPVILLLERQGWESIRDASKGKKGGPPPTFHLATIEDLRAAVTILATEKEPLRGLVKKFVPAAEQEAALAAMPYLRPESVAVDSISEAFRLVADGVEKEAPSKISPKSGLPVRGMDGMGVIRDRCERLLRTLRDLGDYQVLLLAQLDDREKSEGDDKVRSVGPMAPMRYLQQSIASVSNAVGITERRRVVSKEKGPNDETKMEVAWGVMFTGPDWMVTKTIHGLRDTETQNVGAWLKRIAKSDADAKTEKPDTETKTETENTKPATPEKESA